MHRSNLARASALALALLVAPSACGDSTGPASTTTTAAPTITTASGNVGSLTTLTTAATSTPSTEAVKVIEVTYAGGQVAGGAQRTTVGLGETVRIRVTSDVADEIHVHTYDVRADVTPGQPAQLELVASIPGRHEVELEKKRKQLLVLEVR